MMQMQQHVDDTGHNDDSLIMVGDYTERVSSSWPKLLHRAKRRASAKYNHSRPIDRSTDRRKAPAR